MNARKWLTLYEVAAGGSDVSTGILLLFAPMWTLRLLHIAHPPAPIAFAQFIGAFVLSVGLSYLWIAAAWPLGAETAAMWRTQWTLTALTRGCVAAFLLVAIATGGMEPAWGAVAASDGAMAALQWFGLARGWLRHAE